MAYGAKLYQTLADAIAEACVAEMACGERSQSPCRVDGVETV